MNPNQHMKSAVLWNLQDLARKLGRVLMLKNTSTSFEVNGIIVRDHS